MVKQLKGFVPSTPTAGLTARVVGAWQGMKVVEANIPDVVLGYRDGHQNSGYVYAPYVPFTRTPVILAGNDFMPRSGILTRYGKHLLNSECFARLTVAAREEVGRNVGPLD